MNTAPPEIKTIFPVPVLKTQLNRELTQDEYDCLNLISKNTKKNINNVTSVNTYVLHEPQMHLLRKDIEGVIAYWFEHIISNTDVEPYITQSWLNFTQKGQQHHRHTHANSIISGCYYVSAGPEDKISFDKNAYQQIKIEPKEHNQFNSDISWFGVKQGQIMLFPSGITHMVEPKNQENIRVSLAFNVFAKGLLGKESSLTELKI